MGYNAADGAALVAAAVQAAIHGGAPRRTVAAVAAAVAGTVMSAAAAPRRPATMPQVHTQDAQSEAHEADSPELLLASLRAARRAQRLCKKQRRREAKQAAGTSQSPPSDVVTSMDIDGAVGLCTKHVGALVAAPAQVPASPVQPTAGTSSMQPREHDVRKVGQSRKADHHEDMLDLGIDLDARSDYTASNVASSGMSVHGQSAAAHSGILLDPRGRK